MINKDADLLLNWNHHKLMIGIQVNVISKDVMSYKPLVLENLQCIGKIQGQLLE